ncbi:MAG: argininosuccinate lyase, partial [Tetragenococcus koreensis]|nr:argininosuccinate lyase [Tetragenococcus koreensis]
MKKLWGGRFTGENKDWVDTFGASISFDYQLAKEDILGSLAHVKMLGACAIITKDEMQQIQTGLENLQEKLANDELTFTIQNEDIHLNIESLLTEEIGPVAGKLHTARSRNDQVATDMHLYLKETVILVIKKLHQLRSVLLGKAEENVETIMPGYTHMQHAQPISFGHHLLAYYQMLTRDQERM